MNVHTHLSVVFFSLSHSLLAEKCHALSYLLPHLLVVNQLCWHCHLFFLWISFVFHMHFKWARCTWTWSNSCKLVLMPRLMKDLFYYQTQHNTVTPHGNSKYTIWRIAWMCLEGGAFGGALVGNTASHCTTTQMNRAVEWLNVCPNGVRCQFCNLNWHFTHRRYSNFILNLFGATIYTVIPHSVSQMPPIYLPQPPAKTSCTFFFLILTANIFSQDLALQMPLFNL